MSTPRKLGRLCRPRVLLTVALLSVTAAAIRLLGLLYGIKDDEPDLRALLKFAPSRPFNRVHGALHGRN